MLFHPLILQSIAALKMLFLLTTDPRSAQDTGISGRRTIGGIILTAALASTTSMIIYNPPGDPGDPPPPLYELMVPPPMDLIVWEPVVKTCLNLSPKVLPEVDIGAISENLPDPSTPAAANVLATKSHSAENPVKSKLVVSPFQHLRIPELDWSTPGVPTVKARKAKKTAPLATNVDVWFFSFYVGTADSIFPEVPDPLTQVPTVPDDDLPHPWQYASPMLKFERVCLRKGIFPDFSPVRLAFIIVMRWCALVFTLYTLGTWIVPIPRKLRKAWRAYKRSKRPLRVHRSRRRHRR